MENNELKNIKCNLAFMLGTRANGKVYESLRDYLQRKKKTELVDMLCNIIWNDMGVSDGKETDKE